jgi:hypothetical protein
MNYIMGYMWPTDKVYYPIPPCLRQEENNNSTLTPVVHRAVTVCTTCSENINLAMKIILLDSTLYTLTITL